MKKELKNIAVLGVFALLVLIGVGEKALATIGGPTYIYDFKYNPKDESVYYTESDYGGRGCPPMLSKTSLATGVSQKVYSCDQGEKLYDGKDYEVAIAEVRAQINAITQNFKNLVPISLKKNNIAIDLKFVRTENLNPEIDEIKNSVFSATVYQGDKKLTEMEISGCNTEQPFTFAGYAVPGFDKKIVLLLSTKGDCFEGGYIDESLLVVGGLNSINRESLNFYKSDEALVPNEGTLTVYENESVEVVNNGEVETPTETETEAEGEANMNLYIIFGVAALVLVVLGFVVGRMSKKQV